MNYKNIIKNQDLRFKLLSLLKFLPDNMMIKIQYYIKLSRIPELNKPERFSEKLQWYKMHYENKLMTIAADKFEVRNYVKSKGLEEILVKNFGVYERPEEIIFDLLPNKFVIKTTNGSGTNILCSNKNNLDIINTKKKLRKWLKRDYFSAGREWAYKNIIPKIIIEEFLVDKKSKYKDINDYKILCFNGEPEYIILDIDRSVDHKRNIYTTDWKKLQVETDKKNFDKKLKRPILLDEMLEVARILSEDFPFVRVDLYIVNNKIYFGELTFYPWTGYIQFKPDKFDFILGEKFTLI